MLDLAPWRADREFGPTAGAQEEARGLKMELPSADWLLQL